MNVFAIIPSAGKGKRMNSSLPKQYIKINKKEILIHTLQKFNNFPEIKSLYIPVSKEYFELTLELIQKHRINKPVILLLGGKERQDSVYNALLQIPAKAKDLVLIHDAARPFITCEEIKNSIEFAKKRSSIIVAQRAKDTIKTGNKFVTNTLERNSVWIVQTPQIFRYGDLIKAFNKARKDDFGGTDDASLLERINKKVYLYEVQCENRKITTKLDLEFASFFLK